MKSLKLLFLLLFAFPLVLNAITIEDKQEVYGKWTIKDSPVIVNGEAIVPKGKILKIQAGVEVRFVTSEERLYNPSDNKLGFLRVNGKLVAKGKKNNFIHFTRDGSSGYWGCIYLNTGNKMSTLKYCKIDYTHYIQLIIPTDNATGAITFNDCAGKVKYCLIVNNRWTGINCKNGAFPYIGFTTIYNNNYGLECNSGSDPLLTSCIVYGNQTTFYINGDSTPGFSYSLIEENTLESIYDVGNNILDRDPLFAAPRYGDFQLKFGSPCLNTGVKGKNMGAIQ